MKSDFMTHCPNGWFSKFHTFLSVLIMLVIVRSSHWPCSTIRITLRKLWNIFHKSWAGSIMDRTWWKRFVMKMVNGSQQFEMRILNRGCRYLRKSIGPLVPIVYKLYNINIYKQRTSSMVEIWAAIRRRFLTQAQMSRANTPSISVAPTGSLHGRLQTAPRRIHHLWLVHKHLGWKCSVPMLVRARRKMWTLSSLAIPLRMRSMLEVPSPVY